MKLRIYRNSLRLRLSQTETASVARGETLLDRVDFVPQSLTVRLRCVEAGERLTASFSQGVIDISLGQAVARRWAESEDIGISGGETVQILIEKDFECLHGESENQADCYPNPLAAETGMNSERGQ